MHRLSSTTVLGSCTPTRIWEGAPTILWNSNSTLTGFAYFFLIKFNKSQLQSALEERCRHYIRNYPVIRANLLRTETVINLRDKTAANVQDDRSVVDFLELLTSQRLYEQQSHYCFNNRMYDAASDIQLRDLATVLKKGLQKGVRFVGDSLEDAKPMLQIDRNPFLFGILYKYFSSEEISILSGTILAGVRLQLPQCA